jgi:hypothetical protein
MGTSMEHGGPVRDCDPMSGAGAVDATDEVEGTTEDAIDTITE